MDRSEVLREVYRILIAEYGGQGWWPVIRVKGSEPEYSGGPGSEEERFQVAAGAVLTQNTSWKNAAKALMCLSRADMLDKEKLAAAPQGRIARLIRSSGYYNQKARRLRVLARYFASREKAPDRDSLLSLEGIGPETADSILLYGWGQTFFVVDAYTKRVLSRLGVIRGDESYDRIRGLFEGSIDRNPHVYNEYHALIVEHCKRRCSRVPVCAGCPLLTLCASGDFRAGADTGSRA